VVTKVEMPANREIPIDAVVLIARPDQAFIKEGVFPTIKTPNFVLPPVYVQPNLTPGINALHFLKINRYFAPISFVQRHGTARYGTIIMP
jgi:hypothetical protein